MAAFAHTPVLESEALTYLDPTPGGMYCDGTLGGGGHSRRILERSGPDGIVVAIDRDRDALQAAGERLAEFGGRVILRHGRFGDVDTIVRDAVGDARLHGLLLDIGPSSPQFDRAERGFSFLKPGPIDMRMDQTTGETALDLIRRLGPAELAGVLRDYGEERYAGRIAERIKHAVRAGQLTTTVELADLVEGAIPGKLKRQMKIHPATRTFQALRIAVNHELDELAAFLEKFPSLLARGGRCVIITFHSLEDRLVKRRFRELAFTSSLPPDLARQAGEPTEPVCIPLTRKPVFASEDEVQNNPRARSARLRACEKVAA